MSWVQRVIAKRACEARIDATLQKTQFLCARVLESRSEPSLRGEFFEITPNTRVREVKDDHWSWADDWYLWITLDGIEGGIDIEVEPVDLEDPEFYGSDMKARKVHRTLQHEVLKRAEGGIVYSLRLSAFQPAVMYLTLLTLSATLATAADGYVYTLDADWSAPFLPLSGPALEDLLLDKGFRTETGLENDVEEAKRELVSYRTSK